jgi:hypothetical protein
MPKRQLLQVYKINQYSKAPQEEVQVECPHRFNLNQINLPHKSLEVVVLPIGE